MDFNRLSRGERIVMIASGALLICSFIPLWASYSVSASAQGFEASESDSYSAWGPAYNFVPKLAIILAILALAVTVVRMADVQLPDLPVSLGLVYVGLSGLATLLLLLTVLFGPYEASEADLSLFGTDVSYDTSRGLLLFVGLLLAAGATYGGYLHMQEETAGTPGALGRPPGPSTRPGPPPAPGGTGTTAPPSSQEPPGSTRPGAPPPPPR
jgi:hypothetical protein